MGRFIKFILVFSVSFFLLDKLFYVLLLISPSLEVDKRLERVINGNLNKELIVMGSSRGARNILASQIEDSLGLSSYNLSYPGSNIEFQDFLLRALIKFNQPPQIIILTLDYPFQLESSAPTTFRYDRLYPLSKYDYINDELIKRGNKSIMSKFFMLSRINRKNFDIRKRHFTKLDTILEDGSMPISFQKLNEDFESYSNMSDQNSKEIRDKITAFLEFQALCEQHDIDLYLVVPPTYIPPSREFLTRMKSLKDPDIPLYKFDISKNTYRNPKYFYDKGHLQQKGAEIFTNEVIHYLSSQI